MPLSDKTRNDILAMIKKEMAQEYADLEKKKEEVAKLRASSTSMLFYVKLPYVKIPYVKLPYAKI